MEVKYRWDMKKIMIFDECLVTCWEWYKIQAH